MTIERPAQGGGGAGGTEALLQGPPRAEGGEDLTGAQGREEDVLKGVVRRALLQGSLRV